MPHQRTAIVSKTPIETVTSRSTCIYTKKTERHAQPAKTANVPKPNTETAVHRFTWKPPDVAKRRSETVTPQLHMETATGLLHMKAPLRRSTWKQSLETEARRSTWKRPTLRKLIRKPQPHSPPSGIRNGEAAIGKSRLQRHRQRQRHRRRNV